MTEVRKNHRETENEREKRHWQMEAGESVWVGDRIKSHLSLVALRCSRVVCIRSEEHWLEGAWGRGIHAGVHLTVKWFHTSHTYSKDTNAFTVYGSSEHQQNLSSFLGSLTLYTVVQYIQQERVMQQSRGRNTGAAGGQVPVQLFLLSSHWANKEWIEWEPYTHLNKI